MLHIDEGVPTTLGEADAQLTATIRKELDRQREKDAAYSALVAQQRLELNSVLKQVGKATLEDRQRGVKDTLNATQREKVSAVVYNLDSTTATSATREHIYDDSEGSTRHLGLIGPEHPDFKHCTCEGGR